MWKNVQLFNATFNDSQRERTTFDDNFNGSHRELATSEDNYNGNLREFTTFDDIIMLLNENSRHLTTITTESQREVTKFDDSYVSQRELTKVDDN